MLSGQSVNRSSTQFCRNDLTIRSNTSATTAPTHVELDGPKLLSEDRGVACYFDADTIHPPISACWGYAYDQNRLRKWHIPART